MNFLNNCTFCIDFLKFFESFRVWKKAKFLFLHCKIVPPIAPCTPPPIREILDKLLTWFGVLEKNLKFFDENSIENLIFYNFPKNVAKYRCFGGNRFFKNFYSFGVWFPPVPPRATILAMIYRYMQAWTSHCSVLPFISHFNFTWQTSLFAFLTRCGFHSRAVLIFCLIIRVRFSFERGSYSGAVFIWIKRYTSNAAGRCWFW